MIFFVRYEERFFSLTTITRDPEHMTCQREFDLSGSTDGAPQSHWSGRNLCRGIWRDSCKVFIGTAGLFRPYCIFPALLPVIHRLGRTP